MIQPVRIGLPSRSNAGIKRSLFHTYVCLGGSSVPHAVFQIDFNLARVSDVHVSQQEARELPVRKGRSKWG
jgi:hypothetical protein